MSLTSAEVRAALEEPLRQIIETVKETLERTPPELAADVAQRGIMLAGGGSLLKGFDRRIQAETQMATHLADSPLHLCGAGLRALPRGVRRYRPDRPEGRRRRRLSRRYRQRRSADSAEQAPRTRGRGARRSAGRGLCLELEAQSRIARSDQLPSELVGRPNRPEARRSTRSCSRPPPPPRGSSGNTSVRVRRNCPRACR